MRRPLTLPLLLLLAASTHAADVKLVFEDASERIVFGADALPEAPPTDALRTTKREVSVPENGKNAIVIEPGRNLVYVQPWAKLRSNPKLTRKDATHAYKVAVEVDAKSAQGHTIDVKLKDPDGTKSAKVGTAQNYRAEFSFVRLGTVETSVTDDTGSAPVGFQTPTQLDATTLATPTILKAAIPRAVDSLGEQGTGNGGGSSTPPAPGPRTGSVLGNILSTLIGLAVVGGLAYAAWRYARANPDKVSDALTKIGADVPKPLDPDDPPAATPATTPAPAVQSGPIILDPTPEPIQIPSAPISLSVASTGVPKLLGSDGSAFELPEGETVVGREALGGLMIGHETVSRRHARLVRSGPSVTVEDLGSTNGTWVNDAPAPATLSGGETVRFGQVTYRYEA